MNKRSSVSRAVLFLILLLTIQQSNAQWPPNWNPPAGPNVITTIVPFLTLSPDARAAGMGNGGAASEPDAFANHWNASKLAFAKNKNELGISYLQLLREIAPGIDHYYLSGYRKLNARSAFGSSVRYFSPGRNNYTDVTGISLGSFRPWDLAVDGSYAMKLSKYFSAGMSLRFIYSDLAGDINIPGIGQMRPGAAGAGDVSLFYSKKFSVSDRTSILSFGLNISNIGSKLTYSSRDNSEFLPANLRLGTCYSNSFSEDHSLSVLFDFNKLLIPTPSGGLQDPTVLQAIIGSFADAPGGFREEINEISSSMGLEYIYRNKLKIRSGVFYESELKGSRQFVTFGAGFHYKFLQLDAAYLFPLTRHPVSSFCISLQAMLGSTVK